jgi:hypothetical protein
LLIYTLTCKLMPYFLLAEEKFSKLEGVLVE